MNLPVREVDPAQSTPRPPMPLPVKRPLPRVMPPRRRLIRREKIGPAFWTVASIISLIVNLVLLAVLLSVGSQLFTLKRMVNDQLIAGLYDNFVQMDQATIKTSIPVNTSVTAKFDVPYETDTEVTLTQDTVINNAVVSINGGVLEIRRAPTNIILPAGTRLPIHLNLNVPIDQEIPVNLVVDVNIPLNETELHAPFTGLQDVIRPYHELLEDTPDSWSDILCSGSTDWLCDPLNQRLSAGQQ